MLPTDVQKDCPHTTTRKPACAGTIPSLAKRPKPVDRHAVSKLRLESSRPATNGWSCWLKPKPFTIRVGQQHWLQTSCQQRSSSQRFSRYSTKRHRQKTETLVTANCSTIDTFHTKTIQLDLGFRKFKWPFLVANVNCPMLGANFFCSNHLIDLYTNHIIDAKTYENMPAKHNTESAPRLNACTENEFANILQEFPLITQ